MLQISTVNFAADSPAWVIRYETTIPLDDSELLNEVHGVWEQYRNEVERAGLQTAIITAVETAPKSLVAHVKQRNFVIRRQSDGKWRISDRDNPP